MISGLELLQGRMRTVIHGFYLRLGLISYEIISYTEAIYELYILAAFLDSIFDAIVSLK